MAAPPEPASPARDDGPRRETSLAGDGDRPAEQPAGITDAPPPAGGGDEAEAGATAPTVPGGEAQTEAAPAASISGAEAEAEAAAAASVSGEEAQAEGAAPASVSGEEAQAEAAAPALADAGAAAVEEHATATVRRSPPPGLLWSTGLVSVATLAGRDVGAVLVSPVAYAAGVLLVVTVSVFGYLAQVNTGQPATMGPVLASLAVTMAVLTPLVTARALAGERRSGTLDLLFSSPVRTWEIVVGKWLGGLVLYVLAVALTLVYAALLARYQAGGVDAGAVAAGYVGAVLVGAAWVALGLLVSSLSRGPLVATLAGVGLLLTLEVGLEWAAGRAGPPVSDLLDYVSAASRARAFGQGEVALRDVVYFLALTAGGLVAATGATHLRRRG